MIRDIILLPIVDEFTKRFTSILIVTLIDLHLGYNQITLNKRDQDMIVFYILIRLLYLISLLQRVTNLVTQFIRTIYRILEVVYKEVGAFIDDISIKGLKIDYNREEVVPSIQQFVKEYIINVNKVLLKIEYIRAMISTKKT